jgi:hypothetical protein
MTEPKKVSWFTKIFEDYYIVDIIQGGETKVFHLKEIKKINNTLLKGTDLDGNKIEYCTNNPFDYHVKKLY